MSQWQRSARLVIAIGVVAFAVVVAFAFRKRAPPGLSPTGPADPKAVVESANGWTNRVNREQEEVHTEYQTFSTYPDGSTKMLGVKGTTGRAGGRTFVI